ncbi:MAG: LysR family transcriptional regulator [Armatimonadetes bacterium]|nr:LysR family transcriptional regulator [Armatimonadota bacterium]
MEIDQLKLFVDLVREQSFTRVAQKNFITQPAVSLSIQKLEEELGTRLLERTTRKVLVTDEGRVLYEYARNILDQIREARTALQERQDKMLGSLSLATVHSVGIHELPVYLKEFIRRYPQVHIHIEYRVSDEVYRSVLEGDADLGIVAYPEERGNLVVIPFYEDEMVVICPPDHLLAKRGVVRLHDLHRVDFIAFEPEIPTRRAIDTVLNQHGVVPTIRMACDNVEIMKKMVEVGLGVALVPALTIRQDVRHGTLRSLPLADCTLKRPLGLLHRRGKSLSRPQRAFVDLVTQEANELMARAVAGK